eukprot:SAG31_NODE_50638_length_109_cov_210.400000_1_plen_36_part_11
MSSITLGSTGSSREPKEYTIERGVSELNLAKMNLGP